MSKKLNTSAGGTPKNTLFNYFAKSPVVDKKKLTPSNGGELQKENLQNRNLKGVNKEIKPAARRKLPEATGDSDPEEEIGKRKRKRIVLPESESEEEYESKSEPDFSDDGSDYQPDAKEATFSEESASGEEEVDISDPDTEDDPTPKKNSKKSTKNFINNNNNEEPASKKVKMETPVLVTGGTFMEKLQQLQSNAKKDAAYDEIVTTTSNLDEPVVWPHQKLDFLQPDKIKDKAGRRPDHPDYDKSTLHVPEKFLNSLSPGVRQWWVLKSDNFDCVLFFKVGKFYELYHGDADVGVNELGFTYMRGEFAHSGFPEISFDKMSSILIDRGYKVSADRLKGILF